MDEVGVYLWKTQQVIQLLASGSQENVEFRTSIEDISQFLRQTIQVAATHCSTK